MKLYDAVWAPSPRKVRMYLAEKGIHVERVMVDLRIDEQLTPAYLAINPRGTVPALELDDGTVLAETSAICRYFEARQPEPPLFGTTAEEIGLVEAWTRRIEAEGYAAVGDAFRNSRPVFADRALSGKWPAMPQLPGLVERGRAMWEHFLDMLDARLAQSEWIAGRRISYADICGFVAVEFARATKLHSAERASVARWHRQMAARPSAEA